MFVSHFDRTIDGAGRLILPPPHRMELGEQGYLSLYPGCISLWPSEAWEEYVDKFDENREATADVRRAKRSLYARAEMVRPDSQGRITIPEAMRSRSGLEREVVVAGAGKHLEIWDRTQWAALEEDDDAALEALVAEMLL